MTFYQKLEKYLERGLHVLVKHNIDEDFALVSPFGRDSAWWETEEAAIANCGKDYSKSYWRKTSMDISIVRTYTPEELNPKFKRYEVGDKVVWNGDVWTIGTVWGNGTYNIERTEDSDYGEPPKEWVESEIPHYDLKPYIEEDDKIELNITYDTGEKEKWESVAVIDLKKEVDAIRKEFEERARELIYKLEKLDEKQE